jgi:ligand-binding sensor domain-containing protein
MSRWELALHALVAASLIFGDRALKATDRTPAQWWATIAIMGAVWLSMCRMVWWIAADEIASRPRG